VKETVMQAAGTIENPKEQPSFSCQTAETDTWYSVRAGDVWAGSLKS